MAKIRATSHSERKRWKMITWPIWWGDISTGLLCCFHTNPSKIGLIVTFTLQPYLEGFIWRHRSITLRIQSYLLSNLHQHWFLAGGHFWSCSFWDCSLHLQWVSGKFGWNVKGTKLFGSFQQKLSGSNGTSEKVVPMVVRFFFSISSKPSLIPVSGLRGRFSVNGSDLYKW